MYPLAAPWQMMSLNVEFQASKEVPLLGTAKWALVTWETLAI